MLTMRTTFTLADRLVVRAEYDRQRKAIMQEYDDRRHGIDGRLPGPEWNRAHCAAERKMLRKVAKLNETFGMR